MKNYIDAMKINQLFVKPIDMIMLESILYCFTLSSLNDKKMFSKTDLAEWRTVQKLQAITDVLRTYYIPCKARLYLDNLTEKKAITVLKQVLRIHGYALASKEKNIKNKKMLYYQLTSRSHKDQDVVVKRNRSRSVIIFD